MNLKNHPIITHAEILSRAIRSINEEIEEWTDKCATLPQEHRDTMFAAVTYELTAKRDALETLYRIETGVAYDGE